MTRSVALTCLYLAAALVCVIPTAAHAALTMERHSGGTVVTSLSASIKLNEGSSLQREWFVLTDSRMPVAFAEPVGVQTAYQSQRVSGRYVYEAPIMLRATADVQAVEVRIVVLDVFGKHQRTLSATYVVDIDAGQTLSRRARWNLFSETDAATAFASIAYVANVRAKDGRVYSTDMREVLEQVRKVTDTVQIEQLSAERPPRTGDD